MDVLHFSKVGTTPVWISFSVKTLFEGISPHFNVKHQFAYWSRRSCLMLFPGQSWTQDSGQPNIRTSEREISLWQEKELEDCRMVSWWISSPASPAQPSPHGPHMIGNVLVWVWVGTTMQSSCHRRVLASTENWNYIHSQYLFGLRGI